MMVLLLLPLLGEFEIVVCVNTHAFVCVQIHHLPFEKHMFDIKFRQNAIGHHVVYWREICVIFELFFDPHSIYRFGYISLSLWSVR